MNTWRYSASAKLGVFDSVPADSRDFRGELHEFLQKQSHASLECNFRDFVPVEDDSLATLLAICDKIVARGNPTLLDLDFETRLIEGPLKSLLPCEKLEEHPEVGYRYGSLVENSHPIDLITAAKELLSLPYRNGESECVDPAELSRELKALTSPPEDVFYEHLVESLNVRPKFIHRQSLIPELVADAPSDQKDRRVDFSVQTQHIRWIFEIDGEKPNSLQEANKLRDDVLQEGGWSVYRLNERQATDKFDDWFQDFADTWSNTEREGLERDTEESILSLIHKSPIHEAAYYSVLQPLATHRCLRGIVQLFLCDILDPHKPLRVLVIEEDLPAAHEAFSTFLQIWGHLHILAPHIHAPPHIEIDVIGDQPAWQLSHHPNLLSRIVTEPTGEYDATISVSSLLWQSQRGIREYEHYPHAPANYIAFRHAVGFSESRRLQWSNPLHYRMRELQEYHTGDGPNLSTEANDQQKTLLYFLRTLFRKRQFRDGQAKVILRLLQGQGSIVLLPTGGGKSLTYQYTGLLQPGLTMVVDPLVSLMQDQVSNLQAMSIDLAGAIHSQLTPSERENTVRKMTTGELAFVFITPDRFQSQAFRIKMQQVLAQFPISMAVIDEAHCVSEWGHDFRPAYLRLASNIKALCRNANGYEPTSVALTGTASFAVLTDIQMEMGILDENAIILPESFDRKELRFDVVKVEASEKEAALHTLRLQLPRKFKENPQRFFDCQGPDTNSGLVFSPHTGGSMGVMAIAKTLGHSHIYSGKKPKYFPGDAREWDEYKLRTQQMYKDNNIQELVTTKSFGMGIDKPNIRYTIHYCLPQSVEAFYQEAGRAGRNGIPNYAICAILYSDDNWDSAMEILSEPNHKTALQKLNKIAWRDRGDILTQMWFLLDTYKGRDEDKENTLNFWNKKLAQSVTDMPPNAVNTIDISWRSQDQRGQSERAIFRLSLLGVVDDYTVDWTKRAFSVKVRAVDPSVISHSVRQYLLKYKFKDWVDARLASFPTKDVHDALEFGVGVLVDYIYDELVEKRKQALRSMGEYCRTFTSDEQFRSDILAYLQDSEFSSEIREEWVQRSFAQIGFEKIEAMLERVKTLEEAKRLVGTTRRMLDEDPQNLALRYLSLCARAQSAAESDSSVLQEGTILAGLVAKSDGQLLDPEGFVVHMLKDVGNRRPSVADELGMEAVRKIGAVSIARAILRECNASTGSLYSRESKTYATCIGIVASNVANVLKELTFYQSVKEA